MLSCDVVWSSRIYQAPRGNEYVAPQLPSMYGGVIQRAVNAARCCAVR